MPARKRIPLPVVHEIVPAAYRIFPGFKSGLRISDIPRRGVTELRALGNIFYREHKQETGDRFQRRRRCVVVVVASVLINMSHPVRNSKQENNLAAQ